MVTMCISVLFGFQYFAVLIQAIKRSSKAGVRSLHPNRKLTTVQGDDNDHNGNDIFGYDDNPGDHYADGYDNSMILKDRVTITVMIMMAMMIAVTTVKVALRF